MKSEVKAVRVTGAGAVFAGRTRLRGIVLVSDGGDISLVSINDNKVVNVKLHGNCVSCSVNQMTLKTGVEMTIKKHAPEIEKVVSVE